jgi:phosphatidylserine/phosphatidylglycerophosphate/cardiolipin synthase-like enzyme
LLHDPAGRAAPSQKCEVEICTALLELIEGAEESIDFAIYGMRDQPGILAALEAAKARGVRVRGIVDRDLEGKNYYSSTEDLVAAIVDVRGDMEADQKIAEQERKKKKKWGERESPCERPDGFTGPVQCLVYELGPKCLVAAHASREPMNEGEAIMHHKFFVVDRRFVWTGSTNVSDSGIGGYNANLVTVVDSTTVAGWYAAEFEQMYDRGLYHTLKESLGTLKTRVGDADLEVYFSPQDRAISQAIRPLLQKAESKIDIAVFFLTNKHITADLIDAKLRGVQVRIILDATAAKNGYTKHELLRTADIPVKIENWGGKMHMKSAAIDGKTVITGSMNWTSAGEFSNDENTIIVHSATHAAQYHAFFDTLWGSIDDRWLQGRPDPESIASGTSCSDGVDDDFDKLVDGEDPGCGQDPPALPPLPPHALVPKSDQGNCPYWRPDLN